MQGLRLGLFAIVAGALMFFVARGVTSRLERGSLPHKEQLYQDINSEQDRDNGSGSDDHDSDRIDTLAYPDSVAVRDSRGYLYAGGGSYASGALIRPSVARMRSRVQNLSLDQALLEVEADLMTRPSRMHIGLGTVQEDDSEHSD